ncbi:hypothetical protein GCK32_014273, partial [Trichostrongylus colubriformis]
MKRTILGKFSEKIQRAVLKRRKRSSSDTTESQPPRQHPPSKGNNQGTFQTKKKLLACWEKTTFRTTKKIRRLEPRKTCFEDVHIVLDTGADRFFITSDYAKQLGLQSTGSLQLTIHTFGNDVPMEKTCPLTSIELEDRKGDRHAINLAVVDYISGTLQRTPLKLKERILRRTPELREHHMDNFITAPKYARTLEMLIRNHQAIHVDGKITPRTDRLVPMKVSKGLIRCRGRLQQSDLTEDSKFPINCCSHGTGDIDHKGRPFSTTCGHGSDNDD